MKRVYLAGKMGNRPLKDVVAERREATALLVNSGFEAVDPFEEHLKAKGKTYEDILDRFAVIDDRFQKWIGLSDEEIVEQDKNVLKTCQAVIILTGDEVSSGTWFEFAFARYVLDIPVVVIAKFPTGWTKVEATFIAENLNEAVYWLEQLFKNKPY